VFFHYTKKFPRVLRVLALSTNIITMLFIQSITYNLTNGDDGSCERLHDEVSCLEPKSGFATGTSKCYWVIDEKHRYGGGCHFVQPDKDLTVIIFVAVFSAIISTPIAFTAGWAIEHILSSPTDNSLGRKRELAKQMSVVPLSSSAHGKENHNLSHAASVVPDPAGAGNRIKPDGKSVAAASTSGNRRRRMDFKLMQSMSGDMVAMKQAEKSYNKLQEKLKAYRSTLTSADALLEFDSKLSFILLLSILSCLIFLFLNLIFLN
jgi:hypothetical protein